MPAPVTVQRPLLPVFAQQVLGHGVAQTGAGGSGKWQRAESRDGSEMGTGRAPTGGGVDASDISRPSG